MVKQTRRYREKESSNKCVKLCKKPDLLGHPVELNYDGQASHKTAYGGFITLCLSVIFLYYFGVSASKLTEAGVDYKNTIASQLMEMKNLTVDYNTTSLTTFFVIRKTVPIDVSLFLGPELK